eukprot:TRINITY_DN21443_c0_g1_i1.p2 TRINITY_DN21443_c0_g1~~TRINITY_DN21443_c0_g1_i1.p2  ORF type:complete len:164 (-),score=25.07 TRINITY_DN21443_c0_g1_i1:180-671(-)
MPRSQRAFEWVFSLKGAGDSFAGRRARKHEDENSRKGHSTNGEAASTRGRAASTGAANRMSAQGGTRAWESAEFHSICKSSGGFRLQFVSAVDAGIDSSLLLARREKERQSLEVLEGHMATIRTMEQFHEWFHTQHGAYSVAGQADFGSSGVLGGGDPAKMGY